MINPHKITDDSLPLIVLSDHTSGFIQWAIKFRTNAQYNHIMIMHRPKKFASQGNVYSEINIDRYMTNKSRLKFWTLKGLTGRQRQKLISKIGDDIKKPWHKRMYDYFGILGQLTGLKFINNPLKMYCSERVAHDIRPYIYGIPEHPSPKDLNEFFKKHPDQFEVYGRWSAD